MIENGDIRGSSKLRDILDSAATKKLYYFGDMMNEWCYEDQAVIYIDRK